MTQQTTYYRSTKLDYLYDAATSIDDDVKLVQIINNMKPYQIRAVYDEFEDPTVTSIMIKNILIIIGVDLKKLLLGRELMSFFYNICFVLLFIEIKDQAIRRQVCLIMPINRV